MCQSTTQYGSNKPESDDELKWEEFYGTSVDITSTLLDMFDTIVAKNSANDVDCPSPATAHRRQPTPPPPTSLPLAVKGGGSSSAPPCDPGGTHACLPMAKHTLGGQCNGGRRPVRLSNCSKRSYSDAVFEEKKRPLSTSSVSSSSSSSSSSLPRNGLDVKKSYLASIESLDDEDHFQNDGGPSSNSVSCVGAGSGSVGPGTTGPTVIPIVSSAIGGKPRWCDPNLSHTDKVVLEIVDTERTYVRDLDEIIQGYLKYIKEIEHQKVSQQCLEDLFSNIEDIYKFNSSFVEELERCGMDPVAIARCFINNSEGFEVYTQYCTNYPRTMSVLTELVGNSKTAEIFKERQMALQHSLPLGSYLLKPVQRILKYHLLLKSMVKHFDKDKEGYADIKNGLSIMTGIAYHIDDMKRKHEHAVRVQEIQSLLYGWEGQDLTTYGELVAEGAFRMYRAKALRHLFLFDKMLLIAKKKEEGILSYKTHIMCFNLMLIESIAGEPLCFHVIPFNIPRFQYTFQARNLEQKREWCCQLKRVIIQSYTAIIPTHAAQLVMELGQSKLEDSPVEKTTSKRQLSAPEYLEKRKQERRKSEINLKRGLKLKSGSKKGELSPSSKNSSSGRRKSASTSNGSHDKTGEYSRESWSSQMDISGDQSWTRSQDDMAHSENKTNGYSSPENGSFSPREISYGLFNRDSRLRHSLPEPAVSQRSSVKDKSFRPSWRAWNSVPEETTDTENEDSNERGDYSRSRNFRPSAISYESETLDEPYDSSGEYVTFFYAHAYATRDWPESARSSQNFNSNSVGFDTTNQNKLSCDGIDNASSSASSPSPHKNCTKSFEEYASNRKHNSSCHETTKTEAHTRDQDSESGSSNYSWKQNAAIRRVQSFTGMAKAKMSSLHHNISFKHHSRSSNGHKMKPHSDVPTLPVSSEVSSPTTPATWLQLQEDHLACVEKKSGSLPRSFQLGCKYADDSSDQNLASHSDDSSLHRVKVRCENSYSEQRPYTIASDKPTSVDFSDDMSYYVLECSPDPDADYCLLVRRDHYEQEMTSCTNTPAVSIENVHSIHPELKIYHQAASKYSTLKQVFTNMGAKIASLKAALKHPSAEQDDTMSHMASSEFLRNDMGRCSSRASIRSEGEHGSKMLTVRLAQSVAKAYSAVVKHRTKKCDLKPSSDSKSDKWKAVHSYKSESSLIGARMAHPLESEYSVPKNIISPQQLKKFKDDLRPDSLLSESSNATSSSDGDKVPTDINSISNEMNHDKAEDNISEASVSSADSYYEKKFDAIENALFRDSAIYSDSEEADFSAVELPNIECLTWSEPQLEKRQNADPHMFKNGYNIPKHMDFIVKRPVNQAIMEKLRILEENMKSQREETVSPVELQPSSFQKKVDVVKWSSVGSSREFEESETSSEHSSSTVHTVMESGNLAANSIENFGVVQGSPRIKGWVKHVVDKLQGEGRV